ncbi:methyl-accepting chemotaxis protein [Lachnospiraceae bacterium A10]|nr:methyl-accepting chemotaxis protein [Lachnospiraceae bacterium A10]
MNKGKKSTTNIKLNRISNSVKAKLITIMLLIALVPLLVAITINYVTTTSTTTTQSQENLQNEAQFLQARFSTVISNTRTALESFADSPTTIAYLKSQDSETAAIVKKHMQEINGNFSDENTIVISDTTGMMILRSDDSALVSIADRDYWKTAITGNANVSSVFVSKSTNSRNLCVAVPISDPETGDVLGVVHRSYDLNNFHEILAAEADEAFLVDTEGLMAAHSLYEIAADDEVADFSESPYMTSSETSGVYLSTKAGYETYLAYVKDPDSGYVICDAIKVSSVTASARKSAGSVILIGIAMLFAVLVISLFMANSFVKPIQLVNKLLSELAQGRFTHVDEFTNRKDEFGDIIRNSNSVTAKLDDIVSHIKASSGTVHESSDELSSMASQIAATTESVADAVQDIAAGASDQATSVQDSAESAGFITESIENVQASTEELNTLAKHMKHASEESSESLTSFHASSKEMQESIIAISDKISATQNAVANINEHVEGISEIAEQTNLLSLNASIEAARAGDAGRGFAVVAEEIRTLADESENMAQKIHEVMAVLLEQSSEAVEAAKEIIETNQKQQVALEETLASVQGMISDIDQTAVSVATISEETTNCVNSNRVVSDAMTSLSAISEENAASTETTGASVEELSATVTTLAESANNLKDIAEKLDEEISFFQ